MAGMVSESTGRRVFLRVFAALFALSSGSDVGGGVSMGSGAVASGNDGGEDSSSLIAGVAILRFDFRFIPAVSVLLYTHPLCFCLLDFFLFNWN